MSTNIIPFPSHRSKNRSEIAPGKQTTSSPNTLPQGSAKISSSKSGDVDMLPQSRTTFHMEVNVKLTLETSHAR